MALHIDDGQVISGTLELIEEFLAVMKQEFEVKEYVS